MAPETDNLIIFRKDKTPEISLRVAGTVPEAQQQVQDLPFEDVAMHAVNDSLDSDIRQVYRTERAQRVRELTDADPGFTMWLRRQVESTLEERGWSDAPEALTDEATRISQRARIEHPILNDDRYAGLEMLTLGGLAREARIQRELQNASPEEQLALQGELRRSRRQQSLNLGLDLPHLMTEGGRRKLTRLRREKQEELDRQEQLGKAFRGESEKRLPNNEAEQERLLMAILEKIEEHDTFIGPVIGISDPNAYPSPDTLRELTDYISQENCSEALKRRVVARLRLQHCASVVRTADKSQDKVVMLSAGFAQSAAREYALEGADLGVLFQETSDVPITDAFALLQEAHTNGLVIGRRSLCLADRLDQVSESQIYTYIENQLGGGKKAKKAIKLAWRIADATMESNVWDRNMNKHGILNDAAFFRESREDKQGRGRDPGPRATIPLIESIATSYIRFAKLDSKTRIPGRIDERSGRPKEINSYLFYNNAEGNVALLREEGNTTTEELNRAIRIRNKGYDSDTRSFVSLEVDVLPFDQVQKGSYLEWITYTVVKQLEAQKLLLETDHKPDTFSVNKLDGYKGTLGQVDGGSAYHIRELHVYGATSHVFSNLRVALNLGWSGDTIAEMERNLITPSDPNNRDSGYLTRDELYGNKQTAYPGVEGRLKADKLGNFNSISGKLGGLASIQKAVRYP